MSFQGKDTAKPTKLLSTVLNKGFIATVDHIGWEVFRYLCTGGSAALIDWFFYWFLISFFHAHYLIAALISFTLATIFNYYLSANWVFSGKQQYKRSLEFSLVFIISLVGLAINQFCLVILIELVSMHFMWAKIAATGLIFFWNFFMRRQFVFRR